MTERRLETQEWREWIASLSPERMGLLSDVMAEVQEEARRGFVSPRVVEALRDEIQDAHRALTLAGVARCDSNDGGDLDLETRIGLLVEGQGPPAVAAAIDRVLNLMEQRLRRLLERGPSL